MHLARKVAGWTGLPSHGPPPRLFLFGREGDRRAAVVELLDVDPRVIAALDRGHDDTATAGVEQGDRGRLLAAGTLVRVVTHERGLGDRGVDPAIDPGETRRDLVHGPVQVVDPSLQ